MARSKTRQRISYGKPVLIPFGPSLPPDVQPGEPEGSRTQLTLPPPVLPLTSSARGHRLGVNGLVIDPERSILYSGGRDGVICAWDLHMDLQTQANLEIEETESKSTVPPSTFRQQVQAHTHWINDIALAHNNQALLSASSDITIKLWRPHAADATPPQTIGLHNDYVKTLAVPSPTSDWFVSGGLDRKLCVWDLNGAGQRLCINIGEDEVGSLSSTEKGSVYAMAATNNILASGGPESTVRLWDARSGKRITKLAGHTDNVRDILVAQDGNAILTASSDRTVKVWSTTAGRCMYTFTMHDASVWSLFSSDPDLAVFYSSDRTGVIAKTDTRNAAEMNDGLCVAVCQEHEGVHRVVAAGGSVWAATSRPSINRWKDVNTDHAEIEVPDNYSVHRSSVVSLSTRLRYSSPLNHSNSHSPARSASTLRKLPLKHMLRLSVTADFPTPVTTDNDRRGSVATDRRASLAHAPPSHQPFRSQPEYSIEGQNGLIKHVMLNDRKTVLTIDTAGEVVMWDLLKCVPIKSFGKRHLDEVKDEIKTIDSIANWCTIDTRTGSVAVTLEEHTCFDAEMYADELKLDDGVQYREDQRINLGKWILRYLFDGLICEELKRDEAFRKALLGSKYQHPLRENAPTSIQLPRSQMNGWHAEGTGPPSVTTLKATSLTRAPMTPGMGIAAATPSTLGSPVLSQNMPVTLTQPLSPTAEEGSSLEKREARPSHGSAEHSFDYFSKRNLNTDAASASVFAKTPLTPADEHAPHNPEAGKETPSKEGLFGKKFRMGMSFGSMKRIGRISTNDKEKTAAPTEEKDGSESEHSSRTDNSRTVEESLLGTIQKMRFQYEDELHNQLSNQQAYENGLPVERPSQVALPSLIRPALPEDAPVLRLPPNTTILIQEERPEAGGVADLFEGTVGSLGQSCDVLERAAPMWLGDVLFRNQVPQKDVVKISFVLEPWQNSLPVVAADGNNRLNANRMLRAKKILSYVAERIEASSNTVDNEHENAGSLIPLRPDECLELWCNNQVVPPAMTLATIRAHIWRGGGDVLLFYKSNGRKHIPNMLSNGPSDPHAGITSSYSIGQQNGTPAVMQGGALAATANT